MVGFQIHYEKPGGQNFAKKFDDTALNGVLVFFSNNDF